MYSLSEKLELADKLALFLFELFQHLSIFLPWINIIHKFLLLTHHPGIHTPHIFIQGG